MSQNRHQHPRRGLIAALLAALLAWSGATAQKPNFVRDPLPMPTVSTDTLMKHIVELSSATYRGRMAGTPGYDAAARYAERLLRHYGAQVTEQKFELECNQVENCKFNVYTPGSKEKRVFTLGNEFVCAGMTGRGYADAQMVFVGYGIDNRAFDEYAKVDVKGKIVVVLTGLPEGHRLPEAVARRYQTLRDKARTAEKHGAVAMLAINTSAGSLPYEPQGRHYCGELPHLTTFPILHLTLDCGRELMEGELRKLDSSMVGISRDRKVQSFTLLKKAEIDVNALYNARAVTANVLGLVAGSDESYSDEIIVVGASLDHIGIQGETTLFPGADINASGVAAVLETARLLSQPDYRPRRSILFVLFSGSEQQYLGSRVFLTNYSKLRKVEAFVNAQNIGCGDSLAVMGGGRYPTLWGVAHDFDTAGSRLMAESEAVTSPRGDARAFDQIGIPSLVFTTANGMHHNHVSSDIWENIDRRILTEASQLMVKTVRELADGYYQGRSPKSKALRFELN